MSLRPRSISADVRPAASPTLLNILLGSPVPGYVCYEFGDNYMDGQLVVSSAFHNETRTQVLYKALFGFQNGYCNNDHKMFASDCYISLYIAYVRK